MDTSQAQVVRTSAKGAITRIINWFDQNKNTDEVELFELKLSLLEQNYNKYNSAQDFIEENLLSSKDKDSEDRCLIDDKYCDIYVGIKKAINRLCPSLTNHTHQTPVQCKSGVPPGLLVRLPEVSIKPFTGKIEEWASFCNLFTTLVIDNSSIDNVQKFVYLKTFLRNEPLKIVDNLEVNDNNFITALDLLKDRYENKLSVINAHLMSIIDCKSISKCNASNLREFVTNIKCNIESLKNLKYSDTQLFEFVLIYILEKKLDFGLRKTFHSTHNIALLPSLEEFLDFL